MQKVDECCKYQNQHYQGAKFIIGATTLMSTENIEKDAALERRFQPVKIEEPSVEDAYNMLIGIKSYYEIITG